MMNENNTQFNGVTPEQGAGDPAQGAYAPPQGASVPPQGSPAQGAYIPPQGNFPPQGDPAQRAYIPPQGNFPPQGNPGQGAYIPPQGIPLQVAYAPAGYAQNRRFVPKQVFTADKKDLSFAPVLLILCGVGVFAGLWGGFQAGFTFAFDLMFLALTAYLAKKGTFPGFYALLCGVLSLGLSGVFVTTSNEIVRFFSCVAIVCTSGVWFSALAGKRPGKSELSLIPHIAQPLGDAVGEMPQSVRAVSSSRAGSRRGSKALLGVLCAVPLLCAVIALLIRSDAAFEGMVGSIFKSIGSVVARTLLTLAVTPFVLAFAFSLRKKTREQTPEREHKGLDTAFLAAFTGILAVCYLVYLFSQLAYFVSAFSGFLPVGYSFSYAEYARRGFFELCGIAAINLAVLYLTILLSRKKDGRLPGVLRAIGAFLGLFTLFLIATAVAKNVMYIRNFGMTVLRVGSSAFLCALAVVFLAAIGRCFIVKVRVLPVALAAFACTLCVLGICNINAICAKYNYEAYRDGRLKEIDCEYLYELGEEGAPYLVELAMHDNDLAGMNARRELYWEIRDLYDGEWKEVTVGVDAYHYEYYEPQRHTYPALSQYSIPRAGAYAAIDAFLKEEPEFMKTQAPRQ